jgi:nitroreductase
VWGWLYGRVFEDGRVSKILGLPEYVRPVGIIALGHINKKPERLTRMQRSFLVHNEKW